MFLDKSQHVLTSRKSNDLINHLINHDSFEMINFRENQIENYKFNA